MNEQKRPRYWQLDVLVLVLIALAVALMRAHLSPQWAVGAESGWSLLALLGMGLWVCSNWDGLQRDEQAQAGGSSTVHTAAHANPAAIARRDSGTHARR